MATQNDLQFVWLSDYNSHPVIGYVIHFSLLVFSIYSRWTAPLLLQKNLKYRDPSTNTDVICVVFVQVCSWKVKG